MRALNNTTDVRLLKKTRQAVCLFILWTICYVWLLFIVLLSLALPQSLANGRRIWPIIIGLSTARSSALVVKDHGEWQFSLFFFSLRHLYISVSLKTFWNTSVFGNTLSLTLLSADVILFVFGVNLRVWLTQGKEKSLIFLKKLPFRTQLQNLMKSIKVLWTVLLIYRHTPAPSVSLVSSHYRSVFAFFNRLIFNGEGHQSSYCVTD